MEKLYRREGLETRKPLPMAEAFSTSHYCDK
jgi:hypothetical protein